MPEFKVDKGKIYYEEYGSGAPLLMISGLGSDISSWLPIIIPLSKKFRLLVFDNRGVGRSSTDNNGITIDDMVGDSVALIDHLGLKKVNILGHSMGGMIAMRLAASNVNRLEKLILAATSPIISKRNALLFEDLVNIGLKCDDKKLFFRNLFYWIFSPDFFNDVLLVEQALSMAVNYRYLQSFESLYNQVKAILGFDGSSDLKKIEADTLVLTASDDLLFPGSTMNSWSDKIRKSEEIIIKNAGHSLYMDKTELFINKVKQFL